MKKMKFYIAALASVFALSSCDSFLDKLPDDRAEVDTEKDVNDILMSAYPNKTANAMLYFSSDYVLDNGKQYPAYSMQESAYRWDNLGVEGNDNPKSYWNACYLALATANQALEGIQKVGEAGMGGQKAEALLCRAFAMYSLSKLFCMAYDPSKADKYLGLPYPTLSNPEPPTRGTLEELYKNINADIEEALPLVDDKHLAGKAIKYHFNKAAAYAFAARFNLYYHNYDKAIEYASVVLGEHPTTSLRNIAALTTLAGTDDICNSYINSGENANLLILPAYSLAGRLPSSSSYQRYAHNRTITLNETFWATMPWGNGSNLETTQSLYYASLLYGSNQTVYFPKMKEQFEYTDKIAGTGYPHIVDPVFTTDETLLVRAEAYTMKKEYDKAIADMNYWQSNHCSAKAAPLTEEVINKFMDALEYAKVDPQTDKERSVKKKLNPQGFTVEPGTQENLIHMVLQMRRIETILQGLRFQDIKRYGIEFSHPIDGQDALIFKAGDLRGAIQLPDDVLGTGLEPNPREESSTNEK